jgi:hypothetical protein
VDQVQLRKAAADLERLLLKYAATDQEAALLHKSLSELIGAARRGEITTALEWRGVPGVYWFTEAHLARYADLEEAYAQFKIEITGGETPLLRKLRKNERSKRGRRPPEDA